MSLAGDRIHALLRQHCGVEHAITAPQIAAAVGMDEREVRRHIAEEFRAWIKAGSGLLLCRPNKGFFFATETEEISHRQAILLSLQLQAQCKVADFHAAMREAGFGGLVTHTIPKTFADESHPEKVHHEGTKDTNERSMA